MVTKASLFGYDVGLRPGELTNSCDGMRHMQQTSCWKPDLTRYLSAVGTADIRDEFCVDLWHNMIPATRIY